jgi:hypothetical protein
MAVAAPKRQRTAVNALMMLLDLITEGLLSRI